MENKNFISKKGISLGMLSGLTWGLDTVMVGIVLAMSPFVSSAEAIFLAPFVSTFLHDAFSSIWMMVYMGIKGQLGATFKALKTRSGRFIVLGALMGGPVGMTGYLLAVKYIGPAYTASISAMYPAVGAFLAFIFLKEKLNLRAWSGLALSIAGSFILGYAPGGNEVTNLGLGFLFAMLSVLGWSSECVIGAYGMKDEEVSPEQALQIRQLVSAVFYGVIIIPVVGGYALSSQVVLTTAAPLLALTALFGTASYVFYYTAIHQIGATRAMALNITYAAWAIIFQILLLGTPASLKLILCSVAIMLGSIMVSGNPIAMLNMKKDYEASA